MAPSWNILIRLWLQTAWSYRYPIAILMVVFPIIGFAVGMVRPKTYQSSMTILIQEAAKHNPFLEDLAVETRLKDRISALDALLHSRHVLLGVAVDLEWINEETSLKEREDLIKTLSESLKLRLIGEELVELHYQQREQEGIDKVLVAVAQRFMDKVLAPERSAIDGSVRFLEEQIKQSATALATSEEALGQFMSKHADSLPDLHPGNVRRLAEMELALAERRTALEGARARYESLIGRLSQTNPVVSRIEMEVISLSAELADLRSRYTDAHSKVQSVKRKLDRLKNERASLLANAPKLTMEEVEQMWTAAAKSLPAESGMEFLLVAQVEQLQEAKSEIADLERQSKTLEKEVATLDQLVVDFGSIEKQLRQLRSDVEVKRDIHERLMERAEMARVTGALGQFEAPERVKIIDNPTVPTRPSGLPAIVFAVLGWFGSLGLSAGLIGFSEVSNTALRTRQELADLTGLPVLARVPHLNSPLGMLRPERETNSLSGMLRRKTRRIKQ
ncbi:hypothetical protein [Aestuariispira insulae]|uniref:Polysaccharide chain length determinant protein (PEP-CTERM system associated) n=1 Tax=Aestuariispira insulae TaxID=1461337 RepID=A0A3D9H2R1_9PROT|nr:hypothetical protein [Aestuariispira insulae]RED43789.1 polysaccharide chain length determinant protein (PEP-CTERM system associated) [Aestuariispira insulae]